MSKEFFLLIRVSHLKFCLNFLKIVGYNNWISSELAMGLHIQYLGIISHKNSAKNLLSQTGMKSYLKDRSNKGSS